MTRTKLIRKIVELSGIETNPLNCNFHARERNYYARIAFHSDGENIDLIEVCTSKNLATFVADFSNASAVKIYQGEYSGKEFPIDVHEVYRKIVKPENEKNDLKIYDDLAEIFLRRA